MISTNLTNNKGLSLVELLITIAIVVVLSAIGLATFSLYQKRAYNTTALQTGIQLRKAFEAGLADRGSAASTIFAENRALVYDIDGTLTCLAGCSGIVLEQVFPGFSVQPGVKLIINIATVPSTTIQVGHCKALTDDNVYYDGWIISDQSASVRAAIPVDADEVAQCAEVMSGDELDEPAPTATPTATPSGACTPPGGCGDALCDGATENPSNCPQDCSDSCSDNGNIGEFCDDSRCSVQTWEACNQYCGDGACDGGEIFGCPPCPSDCSSVPGATY